MGEPARVRPGRGEGTCFGGRKGGGGGGRERLWLYANRSLPPIPEITPQAWSAIARESVATGALGRMWRAIIGGCGDGRLGRSTDAVLAGGDWGGVPAGDHVVGAVMFGAGARARCE